MPDTINLEWSGVKELTANLHALSQTTQDHLAFLAVAAASRNVKASAQANITSYGLIKSGSLIGNVAIVRKKQDGQNFRYDIGERHGAKAQVREDDNPWYWFMLEFGTKKYKGRHFLSQAFESEKGASLNIMQESLTRGIARTVKQGKS